MKTIRRTRISWPPKMTRVSVPPQRIAAFVPLVVLANVATGMLRRNAAQGAREQMPAEPAVTCRSLRASAVRGGAWHTPRNYADHYEWCCGRRRPFTSATS